MLKQYPDVLTNYNIGKSYEKRNIRAVKLSRKSVKKFLKRLFHQIKLHYKIKTILYFFWREQSIYFIEISYQFMISFYIKGKSNHFHRIHNSCSGVDHSGNGNLYFKWIANSRWSWNETTFRKFWLGFCSGCECRWLWIYTYKGFLINKKILSRLEIYVKNFIPTKKIVLESNVEKNSIEEFNHSILCWCRSKQKFRFPSCRFASLLIFSNMFMLISCEDWLWLHIDLMHFRGWIVQKSMQWSVRRA